ncbi:MAG TPA: DUF1735 domain-containing protein [Flavisolibacter sp.]|nr:DUF1735 domain-containing protein [Flavisolibacter sp.]
MFTSKYFIACLGAAVLFSACKKDEKFDITGDPEVKFFINNESLGNLPVNAVGFTAINHPNPAGSGLVNLSTTMPSVIKFPVFANKPVSDDVVISAELDNSLIAQYNAANNTEYVAFPSGVLNPVSLSAQIRKGATVSADSFSIPANTALLNTLTEKAYMAPIKLTTVSKPGVGSVTSTPSTRVTYVVLNTELRRIKYQAVAADALGTLITPRTAWTVAFSPAPTTTGNIFDGSTTTFTRWTAPPGGVGQVDVNMQTTRNVTGIRLYTTNSATLIPTQVEVYLSEDGINYDHIGTPLRANLTYASSYNYILFYKAIPAKYIRLRLSYSTSTNTQNLRVSELDVYAN